MTVIVWDGSTLATDTAANDGNSQWYSPKAWYHVVEEGPVILAGAGPLHSILAMREWFLDGRKRDAFPVIQTTHPCHFIVVNKGGLYRYEDHPLPIEHGRNQCAFGEGKDFAYGALAMGATSQQSVTIANQFSTHCGMSVEVFEIPHND